MFGHSLVLYVENELFVYIIIITGYKLIITVIVIFFTYLYQSDGYMQINE